ncbi:MAG: orotate phosphoribosyltransferase [Microscillaceae bacterium]|nr:orotate phosphoribosyltransferase [Microscillaceae bacterium]
MTDHSQTAEQIAKMLLEINAVQFSFEKPFVWSSGWNSPIYCDSRLSLSYPEIRTRIKEGYLQLIKNNYPEVEAIVGVATAGVPQGAIIADALNLPFLYVRPKPKEHGKENLIEGRIVSNQKVVLVEDIISTGNSSIKSAEALRNEGLDVIGVIAIFTYGFDFAEQNFAQHNLSYTTLTDYTKLLVEVFKKEGVSEKTMASLHEWRKKPDSWSPRY